MGDLTLASSKTLPFILSLQRFFEAAELMERIVMIPSKLTDMTAVATDLTIPRLLLLVEQNRSLLDWFNAVQAFRHYLLHGRLPLAAAVEALPNCKEYKHEGAHTSLETLCADMDALGTALQQLAACATYLTRQYQESLGDYSSCSIHSADPQTELDTVAVAWQRYNTEWYTDMPR